MTRLNTPVPDPKLDLVLERIVDIPPELVWKAWTRPEHIMKWFTPAPWQTVACSIDLRPGGAFLTTMRSPEGQDYPNTGCYLEIVENERLTWTDVLEPGYRPARPAEGPQKECSTFGFTAMLTLTPHGRGTKYHVLAMHRTEADRKTHEEMGFHEGWGTCLDQLVAYMKSI